MGGRDSFLCILGLQLKLLPSHWELLKEWAVGRKHHGNSFRCSLRLGGILHGLIV